MLSQLIYVSKRKENCTDQEIQNILDACKRNNPELGITGILLYSESQFIQLVEGESKVILNLYDKIKVDDRHKNCIMISLSSIKSKTFPSWHMGSKKLNNNKVAYDTDISNEHRKTFENILEGKEEDGEKAKKTLEKFFLN